MPSTIQRSVGRNGFNAHDDTKTVQRLLNNVPPADGGPTPKLEDDGLCGRLTIGAIFQFQLEQFSWQGADGRVDPGRQTLAKLWVYEDQPPAKPELPELPPPPPTVPVAHNVNKFMVQPAVKQTPFGANWDDWFFKITAVPYQHTGIYYFLQRSVVRPFEIPDRFAPDFILVNTKQHHSAFELAGQSVYATFDHDGSKNDKTSMLVVTPKETIDFRWSFNHLFTPSSGHRGGTMSTARQGQLILMKKIINSGVL